MITGSAVGTFMCLKNVLDGHFTVGDYIMFGTYIGEYRNFLIENLNENFWSETWKFSNGKFWTQLDERKLLNRNLSKRTQIFERQFSNI